MKTLITALMFALTATFLFACSGTPEPQPNQEPEQVNQAELNERKVSLRDRKMAFAETTERETTPRE